MHRTLHGEADEGQDDKLTTDGGMTRVRQPDECSRAGPEMGGEKQRKQVRKALAEGKNVKAKVTVRAKDAAGNVATAKRTIRLVK